MASCLNLLQRHQLRANADQVLKIFTRINNDEKKEAKKNIENEASYLSQAYKMWNCNTEIYLRKLTYSSKQHY